MLSCSWCGRRPEAEFDLLGVEGPAGGEWSIERWWHRTGCGRPVVLARNLMAGDAFALQPAALPAAGPPDVHARATGDGSPGVAAPDRFRAPVPVAAADGAAADGAAAEYAAADGAAAECAAADGAAADGAAAGGAAADGAAAAELVGVAEAVTMTRTPAGDVVGYHWPPDGATGNGTLPTTFSFNWIGVPVPQSGPVEPEAVPAADAADDPADEGSAAEAPVDEEWADDVVIDELDSGGVRLGETGRRGAMQAVRRPTARPVAGWGESTPAAQQVDLTRRAPVAVVPRRPETPGGTSAPEGTGS